MIPFFENLIDIHTLINELMIEVYKMFSSQRCAGPGQIRADRPGPRQFGPARDRPSPKCRSRSVSGFWIVGPGRSRACLTPGSVGLGPTGVRARASPDPDRIWLENIQEYNVT